MLIVLAYLFVGSLLAAFVTYQAEVQQRPHAPNWYLGLVSLFVWPWVLWSVLADLLRDSDG